MGFNLSYNERERERERFFLHWGMQVVVKEPGTPPKSDSEPHKLVSGEFGGCIISMPSLSNQ